MRKLLLVAFFLSAVILTPHIASAADARCCNKQEANCTFNCTYSCRFKTPQAPCDAASEEEADCLGQAWHNMNAGVACAEMVKGLEAETDAAEQERVFSEIKPKLQIPVGPNFQFSGLLKKEEDMGDGIINTYLYVPYLADYFSMVYKYLIGIAGILAGIMIAIAGFQWLLAAGDAGKIKHAKERISGALIGLVLALGSYTILFLVNPDLVTFKSLKLSFVPYEELETFDDPDMPLTGIDEEANQSFDSGAFTGAGGGNCDGASVLNAGNYFKNLNSCNGADHCIWGVSMMIRQAGCYSEGTTPAGSKWLPKFLKNKNWIVRNFNESPEGARTNRDGMQNVASRLNNNEFVIARTMIRKAPGQSGTAHHFIVAKVNDVTWCLESGGSISKAKAEALGAPACYTANLKNIAATYKSQGTAVVSAQLAAACNTCTKITGHGPGFDGIKKPYSNPLAQIFMVRKCSARNATAILCPPNLPGPCTRP